MERTLLELIERFKFFRSQNAFSPLFTVIFEITFLYLRTILEIIERHLR